MKFKLFILSLVLLISFSVDAAELKLEKFSFQLPGNWSVKQKDNATSVALLAQDGKKKELAVTVMHPSSPEETVKFLQDIQDYITNLKEVYSHLKVETKYSEYKTKYGAPFMYITYSDEAGKGFYIGASLGSDVGILMITFKGQGNYSAAVKEFKQILESMKLDDR